MGRMHWIVATLALGSLVLGSFALGSLAAGSSALAGAGAAGEIGTGFTFAPGQQGLGKVFHGAEASGPALGTLYLQNNGNDPTTAPPGQSFRNYGQSEK